MVSWGTENLTKELTNDTNEENQGPQKVVI